MCYSKRRTATKQLIDSFKASIEARNKYTMENQVPKFFTCLLEFMENSISEELDISPIDEQPLGWTCFSHDKPIYVRHELRNAYKSCSTKEKVEYYSNTIKYLVEQQPPNPSQLLQKSTAEDNFEIKIVTKRLFNWQHSDIVKTMPSKFSLIFTSVDKKSASKIYDLRNYLLRQSKQHHEYSYVLEAINKSEPSKIRFALLHNQPDFVFNKMNKLAADAHKQNVRRWKKPITHVEEMRLDRIEARQILAHIIKHNEQKNKNKGNNKDLWTEIECDIIKNPQEQAMGKRNLDKQAVPSIQQQKMKQVVPFKTDALAEIVKSASKYHQSEKANYENPEQNQKNSHFQMTKFPSFQKKMTKNLALQTHDTKSEYLQNSKNRKLKTEAEAKNLKLDEANNFNNESERPLVETPIDEEGFGNASKLSKSSYKTVQSKRN